MVFNFCGYQFANYANGGCIATSVQKSQGFPNHDVTSDPTYASQWDVNIQVSGKNWAPATLRSSATQMHDTTGPDDY